MFLSVESKFWNPYLSMPRPIESPIRTTWLRLILVSGAFSKAVADKSRLSAISLFSGPRGSTLVFSLGVLSFFSGGSSFLPEGLSLFPEGLSCLYEVLSCLSVELPCLNFPGVSSKTSLFSLKDCSVCFFSIVIFSPRLP